MGKEIMPNKDGTGPWGEGPARIKMGPCSDPATAEETERIEKVAWRRMK